MSGGQPPIIAVDANGADQGVAEVAAGAAMAARAGARVLLFGPAAQLGCEGIAGIEVVDAPRSIAKERDPARAVRAAGDASIVQAVRAVSDGRADAFVSGGSTGAALAAGIFDIKRARGIHRPALALTVPVPGNPVTLLDVGASTEARPEHLVQFGFMGASFARAVQGLAAPRVGILSNGEEATRGSAAVLEAGAMLATRCASVPWISWVGNVEGDGLVSGVADVVVCDGFTGNIALKLTEGVAAVIFDAVREVAESSLRPRVGGLLLRPALREFRAGIDPEAQGGAYLLGLRRLGVVAHGRFSRTGFCEAILRASRGVREDVVGATHLTLEQAGALRRAPSGASAPSEVGNSVSSS